MSIAANHIIVATDIYNRFITDTTDDFAAIATGLSELTAKLNTNSTVPSYMYYGNTYTPDDTPSVIEQLIDKLNIAEKTYTSSWAALASLPEVPRHLQAGFDGTEASGKVVKYDFIGAYHLRHFIESLHAVASSLRNIKIYYNINNNIINIGNDTEIRNAFNDFALNNNQATALDLANDTIYVGQLTNAIYVNKNYTNDINLRGRQFVSTLTSVNNNDTSKVTIKDNLALTDFYDQSPAAWYTGSTTGAAQQYNNFNGINYPPDSADSAIEKISDKLADFYTDDDISKIRSKTGGTRHIVTAQPVNDLFNYCKELLKQLKVDLLGLYTEDDSVGPPVAGPFTGYMALGYPYNKNWFITIQTGENGKNADITAASAYDNHNIVSSCQTYGTDLLSLYNDMFVTTEDWNRNLPARTGYRKDAVPPIYENPSYYVAMPVTNMHAAAVNDQLITSDNNIFLKLVPGNIRPTNSASKYLNLDNTVADAYKYINRLCICYPKWKIAETAPPTEAINLIGTPNKQYGIRGYFSFIDSYKNILAAANAGMQTNGKYINQCVLTANCYDTIAKLANSDAQPALTATFALCKNTNDINADINSITTITSQANLPTSNIAVSLTCWASINEVNRTHGTTATVELGLGDDFKSFEMSRYTAGPTNLAPVVAGTVGTNCTLYIDRTSDGIEIPKRLEYGIFKFRNRYAVLYGPDDLLAKPTFDSTFRTNLQQVLEIGIANSYFQGCAGGAAIATYVFNKNNNNYGAAIPETIKYAANIAGQSCTDGAAAIAVSQGYFGYDGFKISYDLAGTTAGDITTEILSKSLALIPLPDDITVTCVSSATITNKHILNVSSSNWWDKINKIDIYYSNTSTSINVAADADYTEINSTVPSTSPITKICVHNDHKGFITTTASIDSWDPVLYTIAYNRGNGTGGSMTDTTVTENKAQQLSAYGFTAPSGQKFYYWNTNISVGTPATIKFANLANAVRFNISDIPSGTYTLTAIYAPSASTGECIDGGGKQYWSHLNDTDEHTTAAIANTTITIPTGVTSVTANITLHAYSRKAAGAITKLTGITNSDFNNTYISAGANTAGGNQTNTFDVTFVPSAPTIIFKATYTVNASPKAITDEDGVVDGRWYDYYNKGSGYIQVNSVRY